MYWKLTRNVPSTVRLEEHANTDIANKLIGTCSYPLVWTLRRYASYRRDVVMLDVGKQVFRDYRGSESESFQVFAFGFQQIRFQCFFVFSFCSRSGVWASGQFQVLPTHFDLNFEVPIINMCSIGE
jgi:hypothetical protein